MNKLQAKASSRYETHVEPALGTGGSRLSIRGETIRSLTARDLTLVAAGGGMEITEIPTTETQPLHSC